MMIATTTQSRPKAAQAAGKPTRMRRTMQSTRARLADAANLRRVPPMEAYQEWHQDTVAAVHRVGRGHPPVLRSLVHPVVSAGPLK